MRVTSICSLLLVILVATFFSPTEAGKCRGRYMEMRGGDGFVARGGCRGLDSQIQEEYWTTVGFDGALRDGRTTDDFLVFPESDNNGHLQRNSFVGYWITRSKYGENVHYEAFGHAFIKPDGKVCGWFVGSQKEVVEVCGGFRVLSRSRYNPHQPLPFEWVQGEHLRNRDVLGFHHHKIAKYEVNGDEVLFGDADVKAKKFNGVSIANEQRVEVDSPDTFNRKIWLLKKKNLQPTDNRVPMNIVAEPRRREDLDIYKDPHHEERITNWRLYPYYDQYGRPSSSQSDAHRPAYDSSGRRIRFDGPSSSSSSSHSDSGSGSGSGSSFGSSSSVQNIQNVPNTQNNQISHNYQYYDTQQQPPRNHPGYEEWLRNQYRIRGVIPRGYQEYFNAHSNQDAANQNRYGSSSGSGNAQETNSQNREFEQLAYILQPNSGNSQNNETNQVFYEGGRNENKVNFGNADSENSRDGLGDSGSNSRNSETGETYYSVNPGDPVDASGTQTRVDGEFRQVEVPGEDERNAGDSKNVVIPKNQDAQQQHVRFIRYHPPTRIRDKKGNFYERRVENGKVHYFDASGNEVKTKIDDTAIDMKIERILENRRRQEENLRNLVENSESEDGSDPISAAEVARQG